MAEAVVQNFQTTLDTKKKIRPGIVMVLIILFVIVLSIVGIKGYFEYQQKHVLGLSSESLSKYQAVFLDNNQVYFGIVARIDSQFVTLRDIYYLQSDKKSQNLENFENKAAEQLSLVALGNEVHGPSNEMKINLDHVLFIEDLKKDSKVVSAIQKEKSGQK